MPQIEHTESTILSFLIALRVGTQGSMIIYTGYDTETTSSYPDLGPESDMFRESSC